MNLLNFSLNQKFVLMKIENSNVNIKELCFTEITGKRLSVVDKIRGVCVKTFAMTRENSFKILFCRLKAYQLFVVQTEKIYCPTLMGKQLLQPTLTKVLLLKSPYKSLHKVKHCNRKKRKTFFIKEDLWLDFKSHLMLF